MNDIVNKFLLAGDKSMPDMHLRQPRFNYSACGPFTKNKERIQKFKETGDTKYIYRNELDKTCFQHDMADGGFKDLARRTASEKVLREKSFNIAKDTKYDGYQRGLVSMVYKFYDKKTSVSGIKQNERSLDLAMQQLAEELQKSIIKKLKKKKSIFNMQKTIFGGLI